MQQSKTLFFGIISLALVIVIGLIAARFFLADQIELPTLTEKISIRVVVAPSIKPWAADAAQAFNSSNPNAQVEIIEATDLVPQAQFSTNPQNPPPAAWLAEATFVVELARSRGLAFQDPQSVANSGLVWGAYKSKQDEFNQKYGGLQWEGLQAKASSPENNLNFVIAAPTNSAEGLAALISATAFHLKKVSLNGDDVGQARAWLTDLFEVNAKTPATPGANFATMRLSAGDAGLLSQASWRRARLNESPDFVIVPAQPPVNLDYPLAINSQADPAAQQAAAAFGAFLREANQQNKLNTVFLEPANVDPAGVQADGNAVQRLLDFAAQVLP